MALQYAKLERLDLAGHPDFNERWVQERIIEDPRILGLGDVAVRDRERVHPRAGRLDLLLQDKDPDSNHRYEVELQLGETDPSHIIRVLEYWDIERKRYPQYEHTAVLVAEDVTSRFLNVLGLFNGAIPLIAIQLSAFRLGDTISLAFTTILSELTLGLVDEDEPVTELTDRAFWERQATTATVALADRLLEIIRTVEPAAELKYNKYYVGLSVGGRANNFVSFVPQKSSIQMHIKLPRTDEVDGLLAESGLDLMAYDRQWGNYRARLTSADVDKQRPLLADLVKRARSRRVE